MKKYVKEFFDKAVAKRREHDKRKADRQTKEGGGPAESPAAVADPGVKKEEESDGDQGMDLSDDEDKAQQNSGTPITPMDQVTNGDGLKRKREGEEGPYYVRLEDEDATPSKRPRSTTPPPPPPPPPPSDGLPIDQNTADDMAGSNDEGLNGGVSMLGTPVNDESMEDVDPPPAPPPPTTACPVHLDQDGMEMFDEVHNQKSFTASPTPGPAEGSPDAVMNGGYEVMKTERLQRFEVQNGI